MATNFSANQYENSFSAKRLQNWQTPKNFKEHPTSKNGATRPISNDRGHLLDGISRSTASPWGNFKGTWDTEMNCERTKHCQTLTTLKSENASCLNNQTKKIQLLNNKPDFKISNAEYDKIFQDFNKVKPRRSQSPLGMEGTRGESPAGLQEDIKVASPLQITQPKSPKEDDNRLTSPVLQSNSPQNKEHSLMNN
eukprot:gene11336-12522_t